MPSSDSSFAPALLWLDLPNQRLWRGLQAIVLRPKTFALLCYLLQHAGQLLSKNTLLETLWPEASVSEVALAVCIRELRQALDDDSRTPRFIETVHRRGYRFIGTLATQPEVPSAHLAVGAAPPSGPAWHDTGLLVGRETELHQMHRYLARALHGQRQLLFITGEAGLGKTMLVDAFLERVPDQTPPWVGRGQCLEHYGAGEAYLPVFEALGRLCREPDGATIVTLLEQYAPTWLVHMPGILSPAASRELQQRVLGSTQSRMLREMADVIDMLTARRPLLLILEDLHWSDYATLDLLAALARRREPARLLVLVTYRPPEVLQRGHPLHTVQHELQVHGQCDVLPLACLTETAVADYLAVRFPPQNIPSGLARLLYQRTEGHPLFMALVVAHWVAQGWLATLSATSSQPVELAAFTADVPESLQQMIHQQIDRLRPLEQHVLEVGSVVGAEFSAATVAAGLGRTEVRIEHCCADLARQGQFLQAQGEQHWPDGTVTEGYRFTHALYQEVCYRRVTAARRALLHQRIGAREEAGYGMQVDQRATALALHFERGRDTRRAIQYRRLAADNARRRSAHVEAIEHCTAALHLLDSHPETSERHLEELAISCALGTSLTVVKGYGAPEVITTYARARALCRQVGETTRLFPVLWGLLQFHMVRSAYTSARALGEELVRLAYQTQDPLHLLAAHNGLGTLLIYMGELLPARTHLEESSAAYEAPQHAASVALYGIDLGVDSLLHTAHVLWLLGYPEQARQRSATALALAQTFAHPFSLVHALTFTATSHHLCGASRLTQEHAVLASTLAQEQGFALELGRSTVLQGWARCIEGQRPEGLAQIRAGLALYQATGALGWRLYYSGLLAEACGLCGQYAEGQQILTEALAIAEPSGEYLFATELHRLRGELLWRAEPQQQPDAAEVSLRHALAMARRQHAKALELRAAMSLARLWQRQDKCAEAYALLAEVYGWFTEGLDTADLQEARTLLDDLACRL